MSIALLNPFWYTPPPSFITRTYYDAGYTTAATAINTTQATHKTISTTETAGDEYAFFYQAILDHSGTTSDATAILNESPTERQRFNLESQDATDQFSVGGAYAYAGGTNRTITLDSIEEAAATNEIENYSLCGLKLVASDEFGHSAGQTDSTSTTYATKASVTVGAGTWLILASASVLQSAAGVSKVRLFDGTNTLAEQSGNFYAQDTSNWIPFWIVERVTTTGTTTFSLQNGRVGATGTASIRQATVVALDLSQFENEYFAEQRTNQTTTSVTFVSAFANTFNIVNPDNKHLILGCAWIQINATNRSTNGRFLNQSDGIDYSGTHTREANATTERYPTFVAQVRTLPGDPDEVDLFPRPNLIEFQHFVGQGAGTSTVGEISIAILDLGTTV